MDFLISTCIFAVILVLALVVLSTGRRGGDKTRVEEMLARVTADSDEAFAGELLRLDPRRRGGGKRSIFGALYALKPFARLEQMMWQAGIYLHVSEMLLLTVVLAGVGYGAAQSAAAGRA